MPCSCPSPYVSEEPRADEYWAEERWAVTSDAVSPPRSDPLDHFRRPMLYPTELQAHSEIIAAYRTGGNRGGSGCARKCTREASDDVLKVRGRQPPLQRVRLYDVRRNGHLTSVGMDTRRPSSFFFESASRV